ncbi:hypothetical protein PFISCL1PPCAC_5398, partial [Pristionchus fissidentatus]
FRMLSRALSSVVAKGIGAAGAPVRCFSSQAAFDKAQVDLKKLKEEPDNDVKLKIYALFKQASSGDVSGSRPGMMDFVKRAKYDAHAKLKGTTKDDAQKKYVDLVASLLGQEAAAPEAKSVEGLKAVPGVDFSIKGKVFEIRLNRPSKFNALTLDMYNGITNALEFASNHPSTSVTVMCASGDYYCSGNDLSNFAKAATASKEEVKEMAEFAGVILQKYTQAYIDHSKPLITLCQGPAVGIAITVLPLSDMVIVSDKFTAVTPFATLGQSPEAASSYSFPLLMGPVKASEILLMGRKLNAAEAARLGLVSMVVPHDQFEKAAWKEVEAMSVLPPESLRLNKILLRDIHREGLTKANQKETELIIQRWQSKECANAIAAFMTRKKK